MKNRYEEDEEFFMYSYRDYLLRGGEGHEPYEKFRSRMCGAMINDEFYFWSIENPSYYNKVIREVRPILDKLFIKTKSDRGETDEFIDSWNRIDVDNVWSLNEIVSAHEPEDLVYYIACNSSPEEVLELFRLVMNYIGGEEDVDSDE